MKYRYLFIALGLLLFGCDADNDSLSTNGDVPGGAGGSLARFAVNGDYLYTVDFQQLRVFDISNPAEPVLRNTAPLGTDIETIFVRQQTLFIGAQSGMHIYDVSNPTDPTHLSTYIHVISCDPVVADSNYAYVTLRSGETGCMRGVNLLDIVDIRDLRNPQEVASYPMQRPRGLGIRDSTLFVCDEGLKVFNASDVNNLRQREFHAIPANDVIPYQGYLLVTADDGIYQYSYQNSVLTLLSQIEVTP